MTDLLAALGATLPVLAAPMAGGPTTPELVVAAARAGSAGFLAGGYRSGPDLAAQVAAVRRETPRFGVNLFAPGPVPVDPAAYRSYRQRLLPSADRLGVTLPEQPREDDDQWADKVEVLVADPVPVVSFTFAIPPADVLDALRRVDTVLVQTVTSPAEAVRAADAGVDALIVQAPAAGGHSGTLTPGVPLAPVPLPDLVAEVRSAVDLPLLAAGGIDGPAAVVAARAAGAASVLVGTALLLTDEAGTSAVQRAALTGPDRGDTVLTRAFSGRPARAVPNRFIADHDAVAPAGYPALHHLTSPLRRAAAAAGDPELVNLWAGTGYRSAAARAARSAPSAGDVLRDLAAGS